MNLLLLLILLPYLVLGEGIPKHIKAALRNAKTFKDLSNQIHIAYNPAGHSHKPSHAARVRAQAVRINGASILGGIRHSKMRTMNVDGSEEDHEVDETLKESLRVFATIKQGNDTCKLQSVCVPVNVQNDDNTIIVYPKCIEVMRCVGSCCDSSESCHPHSVTKREFPIIEMQYMGNEQFDIKDRRNITMEEHTSCSCYDCGDMEQGCPEGKTVNEQCDCECSNKQERTECTEPINKNQMRAFVLPQQPTNKNNEAHQGNRIWHEETCTCDCVPPICSYSQTLNSATCTCEGGNIEIPLNKKNTLETELTDISRLPRLKATVKKDRSP